MGLGLAISLLFGWSLYLLYDGLTRPAAPSVPRWERALTGFLARAGVQGVTPAEFLAVSLASGLGLGLLAQVFLAWPVVSVLAAGFGATLPGLVYLRRGDRRAERQQVALVEAVARLRDALRAGLSVEDGVTLLARSGPEALRAEFAQLDREMRLQGLPAALTALRDRLADPMFDLVAAALILNDQVGGRHVGAVLDQLAQATRSQVRLQAELRAAQSRSVLSARVLAAIPLVLLISIRQLNPAYLAAFDTPTGQLILAGCAASTVLGYAAMRLASRLPGPRRILTREERVQSSE